MIPMSHSFFPLLQQIEDVRARCMGWCSSDKAAAFAATVLALRPDITIEIGVFGGSSFFPLALAHKEIGRGKVIGIDPWFAPCSVVGQEGENQKYWMDQSKHDAAYKDFKEKLAELDLKSLTEIHRMHSDEFDPIPATDFLHIDGNHSQQAMVDAERYAPMVRIGGVCFIDDLGWDGGGPQRAATFVQAIGFKHLYNCGSGAMYQRIK